MPDLNPFDHSIQNFRGQGINVRIIADGGVHLPALHAPGEGAYLLQHIGVEHIMVNPVGLGAFLGPEGMVHAQVNIRLPAHQLLARDHQRMPTSLTKKLSPEQVKAFVFGRTSVGGTMNTPGAVEHADRTRCTR